MMGLQHEFWVLDRPSQVTTEAVYAVISGSSEGPIYETTHCSTCGRLLQRRQIRNHVIELYGTRVMDFIWSDGEEVFVSDSLRELFVASDLRGLSFREAEVSAWWHVDPQTNEVIDRLKADTRPIIFQMVVLGKGGSILPYNKTGIKSKCEVCGITSYEPLQHGIAVDESLWDGADFFLMDEFPGFTLMTKRASSYLLQNHIRNLRATPAAKFSMA